MKTPRKKSAEPTPPAASSKAEVVKGVVAFAAPLIAVVNSPAFAETSGGGPAAPAALDPVGLIAAGTGIASLGAYQLMKLRARKGPDRKE